MITITPEIDPSVVDIGSNTILNELSSTLLHPVLYGVSVPSNANGITITYTNQSSNNTVTSSPTSTYVPISVAAPNVTALIMNNTYDVKTPAYIAENTSQYSTIGLLGSSWNTTTLGTTPSTITGSVTSQGETTPTGTPVIQRMVNGSISLDLTTQLAVQPIDATQDGFISVFPDATKLAISTYLTIINLSPTYGLGFPNIPSYIIFDGSNILTYKQSITFIVVNGSSSSPSNVWIATSRTQ